MIERLKKDIADNELVIECIRKLVGNDQLIEQEMMKMINKGPPRMRVLMREELRMEIKKLKGKVARLEKKAGKDTEGSEAGEQNSMQMNADLEKENQSELDNGLGLGELEEAKVRLEESVNHLQNELKDKNEQILVFREEIENYKVEVRARDMNIARQQKSIQELHEEIRDLKSLEIELKETLHKKLALEEQNRDIKGQLLDRFVDNQKSEIEAKEKEARGAGAKLQSMQAKLEEMQQKLQRTEQTSREQVSNINFELREKQNQLDTKNEIIDQLQKENESMKAQLIRSDMEVENAKASQSSKYMKLEEDLAESRKELDDKYKQINQLMDEKDELE